MSRDKDKKKGFWKSLFKSSSPKPFSSQRNGGGDLSVAPSPGLGRASDPESDSAPRRSAKQPSQPRKLHKRTASEPIPLKGKAPVVVKGHARPSSGPKSRYDDDAAIWPPSDYDSDEELPLGEAMDLICKGCPAFKGHKRPIAVPDSDVLGDDDHVGLYSTYATVAGNRGENHDGVNLHNFMIQLMTMRTLGPGTALQPWATVEQPSYAFHFGFLPGTVTLNQWATTASAWPPPSHTKDSGVLPRDVDLVRIFGRLKELELGLEDDDPDYMYKNLYRKFLRDPDRVKSPHKTLDRQIIDLLEVLSRPDHWIDFSQPKNQIVTRFIFDTSPNNHTQYVNFFHQLLLSMELDLRINSKYHGEVPKEKVLEKLPPAIKWSLALSRRWRENVRIESYGETPDQVKLRYKLKRRQFKMIKRFAQMMKWPNLAETLASLKQGFADANLDAISSHAMAFFSGLVLPGPSFPFVIMNALIDIDPDEATDELALLIHLNPNCGFQYRSSYTYWTSTSIVGKVLAPTCLEVAGWVGPARTTPDLQRSQIARIRSHRSRQRLEAEHVRSMTEYSDPLGTNRDLYPVEDYSLVSPDTDDVSDLARIELLSLKPCNDRQDDPGPRWYDAIIQFAIDGKSWPLRLTYDVNFISAWPCSQGPHPLYYDYTYLAVKAEEVITIRDWAGLYGGRSRVDLTVSEKVDGQDTDSGSSLDSAGEGSSKRHESPTDARRHTTTTGKARKYIKNDNEDVLVIQAFGVPDNEVLARAWCAHWGLSAVVADTGKTCMACAIREAYAASVYVVILIEATRETYDD
ncbi:hypothetical protein BD289DRAFT_463163 [Coniella lustricola]|uniref:VTC domain-containing protein n=1 Tax=Coniella lustricola TaxID=2025994 RepID=A0A2T2ZX34_9PEZI|nr:hypothetical protein BD289DRAFT_463163 [Coniella lustricola]